MKKSRVIRRCVPLFALFVHSLTLGVAGDTSSEEFALALDQNVNYSAQILLADSELILIDVEGVTATLLERIVTFGNTNYSVLVHSYECKVVGDPSGQALSVGFYDTASGNHPREAGRINRFTGVKQSGRYLAIGNYTDSSAAKVLSTTAPMFGFDNGSQNVDFVAYAMMPVAVSDLPSIYSLWELSSYQRRLAQIALALDPASSESILTGTRILSRLFLETELTTPEYKYVGTCLEAALVSLDGYLWIRCALTAAAFGQNPPLVALVTTLDNLRANNKFPANWEGAIEFQYWWDFVSIRNYGFLYYGSEEIGTVSHAKLEELRGVDGVVGVIARQIRFRD